MTSMRATDHAHIKYVLTAVLAYSMMGSLKKKLSHSGCACFEFDSKLWLRSSRHQLALGAMADTIQSIQLDT